MNKMNFFESRDKHLSKLTEAVEFLGRKVRENLMIFEIESSTNSLAMVSESDKYITCNYDLHEGAVHLLNIEAKPLKEYFSDECIDSMVSDKVAEFVGDIQEDKFSDAEGKFKHLLGTFAKRNKVNEIRYSLDRKKEAFSSALRVIGEPEYTRLLESSDAVKELIKEKKDEILSDSMILNAAKLSNAISKAFDSTKTEWDGLEEVVACEKNINKSLYEMICSQELIGKELSTAKENFSNSWSHNEKISKLASCIYESDDTKATALQEVISEVPYFALATKSDIQQVLSLVYETINPGTVSKKDVRKFTSSLFEMKKPYKISLVENLNSHYGVNINNLKFTPSFNHLASAYSVLFERLSTYAKADSIVEKTLLEFASFIKDKSGVEILDVNDWLVEMIIDEGQNLTFLKPFNLQEVVSVVVEKKFVGLDPDMEEDEEPKKKKGDDKDDKVDDDSEEEGNEKGDDKDDKKKKKKGKFNKKEKSNDDEEEDDDKDKKKSLEEEVASEEAEVPEANTDPTDPGMTNADMVDLVSDLEKLFNDIDFKNLDEKSAEDEQAEAEGAEEDASDKMAQAQEALEIAKAELESLQAAQAQQDPQSAQEKEGKVTEASKGYDKDDVKTAKRQVRRDNEGEGWIHSDEDPTFKASLKDELARGTKEGAYKRRIKRKKS